MGLYIVENEPNTSKYPIPGGCNSCIEYWEKRTHLNAGQCANILCGKDAVHGAHVRVLKQLKFKLRFSFFRRRYISHPYFKKLNRSGLYISPFCMTHNNAAHTEPYFVEGPLVSIDPNGEILW